MELIRISESKLKIILTAEDLSDFELTAEDLDYGNTDTKRMLWDLLGRAKKEVSFDTDGSRILVRLFPSRDGSCELFVTRLGPILCPLNEDETDLHCKRVYKDPQSVRQGFFRFSDLTRLLSVCRRLRGIGYTGQSTAYADGKQQYFLSLEGLDATGYVPIDEYSFISEYGEATDSEQTDIYLKEHGSVIRGEDAVDVLGSL